MKETVTGNAQVTDQFIKTDSTEESVDDVISNIGIYFSGADNVLGEEGWIKVYDEETGNLLVTFTAEDWNKYTSGNPYKYEIPVKHIRVETSAVINDESYFYAYNSIFLFAVAILGSGVMSKSTVILYVCGVLFVFLVFIFINFTPFSSANS